MKRIRLGNVKLRRNALLGNILRSFSLRLNAKYRDKSIWIFGALEGERYDDNSKYLYEYVVDNYPEIHPYWITRNKALFKRLAEKGINVLLESSQEAIDIMHKAGVVVYTHGLDDFGYKCYLYGAYIVNATHAISGIKKDYYLDERLKRNKIKYVLRRFIDTLFDWYKYDLCIVSSNIALDWRMGVHDRFNRRLYAITGLPRNDVLRGKYKRPINRPEWMKCDRKYITFLPTYRPYNNAVFRNVIESFQKDKGFLDTLSSLNAVFLIKPHPVDRTSESVSVNTDVIRFLNQNDVESTQILQYYSDVLITDYSSACMDYALTHRPVILYAPDYEQYDELHGIVDFWKGIYQSDRVIKSVEVLKEAIISALKREDGCMDFTELLIDSYEDNSIKGTSYCQNVMDEIFKRMEWRIQE